MVTGPHDTHGIEALNEFLKLAEDRRDSTVVILAGYGDEDEQQGVVEYLAQYNPGLRSGSPAGEVRPVHPEGTQRGGHPDVVRAGVHVGRRQGR